MANSALDRLFNEPEKESKKPTIRAKTHGHGTVSERRLSKVMGSRLQPGSGATQGAKSDARKKTDAMNFRIENKSTINMSMSVELDWLTKITNESMADSSTPALTISFVNPDGKPRSAFNPEWIAIPLWAFQELLEKANGEGDGKADR